MKPCKHLAIRSPLRPGATGWRCALLSIIFTLLLSWIGPADARNILVKVGESYMQPNEIHIFSGDWITFVNEADFLTQISFGENCTPDDATNSRYGWPMPLVPGEKKIPTFEEPDGTVLHIFSWNRCKSATATITVHERSAKYFERWVPKSTSVHTQDLFGAKSGSFTLKSLGIEGTLVLDGDTEITITGAGMPSPQMETFYFPGNIICDLKQSAPGVKASDGYHLTLNVNGVVNNFGFIDLSGAGGLGGRDRKDAGTPCQVTRYPNKYCGAACTYYDKDRCEKGCGPCSPYWHLPEGCNPECGCCSDVAYRAGENGLPGGNGSDGGNGGNLRIFHAGEFYGNGPRIISQGGWGGSGGDGGGGSLGCNATKCSQIIKRATPGQGGPPGFPGKGGGGGSIAFATAGGAVDYDPPKYVGLMAVAHGREGGEGGQSGGSPSPKVNPKYPSSPGEQGGHGGRIDIAAPCTRLRVYFDVNGGRGGDGPQEAKCSTFGGPLGGSGGKAGSMAIWPQGMLAALVNGVGGDGGLGGSCGPCSTGYRGAPGGQGGAGGNGGTVKVLNYLPGSVPDVSGGVGGAGGECGVDDGAKGSNGADGSYSEQNTSSDQLNILMAGDAQAAPGGILKYTLLLQAMDTGQDAIIVSTDIPPDTVFVSASKGYERSTFQVRWKVVLPNPCQSKLLTLKVKVRPTVAPGTVITNVAYAGIQLVNETHSGVVRTVVVKK